MNNNLSKYTRLRISTIVAETNDTKSFALEPLDEGKIIYEAGQFITFAFAKGDHEERRSYSFSSAPVLNEPMRITVKRIANGEYSRKLIDHARVGDVLLSTGVSGFFRLPEDYKKYKQLFFFAAGSGITPVYSLIKTVLRETDLPVILVYSNRSEKETIFYKELLELQSIGRLQIEFLFNHAKHKIKNRLSKWVIEEILKDYKVPLQETLFYLCGPADYMLVTSIALITTGVPAANIKKENFNTRKHIIQPTPPDTDAHNVTIHIHNNTYNLAVQYPDTILAAAKKKKIQLPYSCEAGNCGSCTATCTQGKVWMAYNEVLMDDEIEKGKVLTCQGYAVGGDVVVEF